MTAEAAEEFLAALPADQAALLLAARGRYDPGRPEMRRAPDGTRRPVGDAEVIPIGQARSALAANGSYLPRSVQELMQGMTAKEWAAHCARLMAETEAEATAAAQAARKANRYASYLRRRNPKYASASYDMLRADQQHGGKVARWWTSPWRPRSLFMTGLSRTGKTTAAYAIANEAHESGAWVEVFTEAELARLLKSDEADAVWSRVIGCELLFLDDWGRARATDWWKEQLHLLLEIRFSREGDGHRQLVTANTPSGQGEAYAELVDRYGDPIVERVIDGGGILMFDGERIRKILEDW
jgi:DNA replication protein DnaC